MKPQVGYNSPCQGCGGWCRRPHSALKEGVVVCWCLVGCVAHTGINTKGAGVVILSNQMNLNGL